MITDGYAQWYAERIWALLPAIYRTLDAGPTPGANGPLRELVNRIGAQAAVVRQNIDRLSENQSIELCDDWVIPYLGDLVATRIVSCLDADAQRIDVAKTIYYRRRAGTLGILEQLAADIATIDARCVEFFRRLGRTRHQFDPPLSYQIKNPNSGPVGFTGSALEVAEGLIGPYSGTPAGGFADLRNRYATSNTGTAFDEFSYTADLRRPVESLGWYNIRNLGVFLWWLQAFPISAATPVASTSLSAAGNPCFTFDPSGRDVPLFAPSQRAATSQTAEEFWGENWASPSEWVLPVAIRQSLWNQLLLSGTPEFLYGNAFWVGLLAGGSSAPVPVNTLDIHPQRGRFSFAAGMPLGTITVNYSFGLLLAIGAGGYNDDVLTDLPLPAISNQVSGGADGPGLDPPLATISAGSTDATLQMADSLTYPGPAQSLTVPAGTTVAVTAASGQRAVLRWAGAAPGTSTWTIVGEGGATGTPTVLILEGIWFTGVDIVLQGTFDAVYLRIVTLDPGTSGAGNMPPSLYETAIDGQLLYPSTLWIEGTVTSLTVERSITGPIRTRNGGVVTELNATDSVIQSIPTHAVSTTAPMAAAPALFDPASLAAALKFDTGPLATTALSGDAALAAALAAFDPNTLPDAALIALMLAAIAPFSQAEAEAAWPLALADLALGFSEGAVSLSRCTILGPTSTHLLSASECILDDIASVDDAQAGCVRFTAFAAGSTLHQPFRSVQIAPGSPLFQTRDFGQPEYVRLRPDADAFILTPGAEVTGLRGQRGHILDCCSSGGPYDRTILEGAENGSEMGVYCLAQIPLKRRGLALKFEEYAPIGQLPVWIDAD
jgi:hypothetical protein